MHETRSRALLAALFALFLSGAARAHGGPATAKPDSDSTARTIDSTAASIDSTAAPAHLAATFDSTASPAPVDTLPPSHAIKSDFLLPCVSVFLPGFGQYPQGRVLQGLAYSGIAVGGLALALNGLDEAAHDSLVEPELTPKDWRLRKILLGAQAYQGAGFLSAYDAFRTAVPAFQRSGEYRFLGKQESFADIFAAPLRFSFLKRPTTFMPLGLLAVVMGGLTLYERNDNPRDDWAFSADDLPFTAALSYNAGLAEEAVFRGYLLPLGYQHTHSFLAANILQALLFGAAHYTGDGPPPWPQALLGYYFGYLERRNQWTISEGIFNHFWWDAIVFTSSFLTLRRVEANASITVPITAW